MLDRCPCLCNRAANGDTAAVIDRHPRVQILLGPLRLRAAAVVGHPARGVPLAFRTYCACPRDPPERHLERGLVHSGQLPFVVQGGGNGSSRLLGGVLRGQLGQDLFGGCSAGAAAHTSGAHGVEGAREGRWVFFRRRFRSSTLCTRMHVGAEGRDGGEGPGGTFGQYRWGKGCWSFAAAGCRSACRRITRCGSWGRL